MAEIMQLFNSCIITKNTDRSFFLWEVILICYLTLKHKKTPVHGLSYMLKKLSNLFFYLFLIFFISLYFIIIQIENKMCLYSDIEIRLPSQLTCKNLTVRTDSQVILARGRD